MLAEWPLDPAVTYLNHGTVGVTPRRVLDAQRVIRDAIERQPSRYILRELTELGLGHSHLPVPRLRAAAEVVAGFVGARGADVVFVDNATTGANAVLRSFPFESGDEVLVTDLGYGGVTNAARFAARERGATVRVVEIPDPVREPAELVAAYLAAVGPRTRLAIVDHITAESALVFPLAEIAALLRARGVSVLADGAHAPGSIPLAIPTLGVDWYVGNLHKWAWAPRSSGILWASPERQVGLHPPVISWGLDQGFTAEFDTLGTRDPSPHLSAPAAIEMFEALGGLAAVQRYNHDLVWAGARYLAERWRTPFVTPETLVGTMATVLMPEPLGTTHDDAVRVRAALLYEDAIEVQVHAYRGRLRARISAQVYNELGDIERLGDAVARRA
jgi:isopenicillin-N epimerase